ncbi:LOW QUALITY PROTEIN: hypothetical protein HID58_073880, partial [Brassica napus]
VRGPSPGFPLRGTRGTRGTRLLGIRGSESCLEAGRNNTGIFFSNIIWGKLSTFFHTSFDLIYFRVLGEMSGSKGDEALAEYKKALEVMYARKAAPKRVAPTENDDEVQIIRSSKRQAVAAATPSSSKKKSKAAHQPQREGVPFDSGASGILRGFFHGHLVASRERMEGAASTKVEMDTLASQLPEEKDASLAKNKEIKALRLKVRNQEETGELAAIENISLRSQLKNREEELNDLKDAAETFEAEKAVAVNGAKVVARWELMLDGQTNSWDPVNTLEQYKTMKITEAELLGLPAPSFEYEPQVLSDEEVKKTPEPAADDPSANRY